MKKRVVHITTVHHALDSRIYYRECKSLSEHYHVILLAPDVEKDEFENIQYIPIGHCRNRLHRISFFQLTAFRKARALKADVYHFHDPELIPTGFLLKLCGFKVIYDVHEDLPKDIRLKEHIPTLLKSPLSCMAHWIEKIAGHFFDRIITVTPDIAQKFPVNKVSMVRNFPSQPTHHFLFEQYQNRQCDLIYIGSINQSRGLKEMIQSASQPPHSLTLIGHASEPICQQYFGENKSQHVRYIPWIPSPQLSSYLNNCKIGLLLLHPTPTFLTSYPLKMFEYMAAGIPIIASNFPEWEQIISHYQCGLTVDPFDIKSIKKAIQYLLNEPEKAYKMGQNGMSAIKNDLNWENESQSLINTYHNILSMHL